jgi:hypothetical protein
MFCYLERRDGQMSYSKEERAEIAANIREFMKRPKKEKFEEKEYFDNIGQTLGMRMLHRREYNMTWYDREILENIARDVEGTILHP